jgi:hypothetical protein
MLCCARSVAGRDDAGCRRASKTSYTGPDSVSNSASPATQTMFCLIYLLDCGVTGGRRHTKITKLGRDSRIDALLGTSFRDSRP